MLKYVNNQVGSSIITAIVMGAIVVGGGIYYAREHSVNIKSVKTDEVSFELTVLKERILEQLIRPQTCIKTLGTSDIRVKSISEIKNIANIAILNTTNKIINNNLSVDQIELMGEFNSATGNYKTIEESFGASPIPAGEVRYGELNLILSIRKENNSIFGTKVLRKRFPIIVKVDESYFVMRCFSSFGDLTQKVRAQTCVDFGGAYNLNTGCTLIGGAAMGRKLKEASCEIFDGVYNITTGKCDSLSFKTSCPAGQYMESFNLLGNSNSCTSFP